MVGSLGAKNYKIDRAGIEPGPFPEVFDRSNSHVRDIFIRCADMAAENACLLENLFLGPILINELLNQGFIIDRPLRQIVADVDNSYW